MRFSIGFNPQHAESLMRSILNHRDRVAEVYFSLPGMPSGRGIMSCPEGQSGDKAENDLFRG